MLEPSSRQTPTSVASYGFYQNEAAGESSSGKLTWYPTLRQRAQAFGQAPYDYRYGNQAVRGTVSRSGVYREEAPPQKRFFYVGTQVGAGSTLGWKGGAKHPVVPLWGLTLGTKVTSAVRVDLEFLYHTKAKLMDSVGEKVEYKQYELGANWYYDFPRYGALRPFVGAGIWGVKGKLSGYYKGNQQVSGESGLKLGLSVATGASYQVDEMLSLLALLRARYVARKDDVYNLEGLLGVRYHF